MPETLELLKLAALVSASSEFMGLATPTGAVLYVNEAGRRLCGLTPTQDVTGMTVLDLVAEADIEKAISEVVPGIAATGSWQGELRLRHVPTGAPILTHHYAYALYHPASGERFATAAVSIDLRQKRRTEARFRAIFESAAVGIALINAEGQIETLNDTFARLLNRSRLGLVGSDYGKLVAAESDLAKAQRQRAELFAGERGSYSCELSLFQSDGSTLPVRAWVSLIDDGDGKPTHSAAAIASLAEQRRLEAKVRQQHKMEALGRMAGGIVHDFNNYINVIGLEASMLASDRGDKTTSLRSINEAVRRMTEMTSQLMTFSRQEKPDVETVDLVDIVHGIEPMLLRIAGPAATLILYLDPRPLPVCANRNQLEQVLVNLVANARDANAERIQIQTELSLSTDLVDAGKYAVIRVSDDGGGIPPEHLSRVFDPFFTTKPPGDGTGLGLMTAYASVSAVGGTITVESAIGEGTTFTITLPFAA